METFSIISENSGKEYSFLFNNDGTVECAFESHKGVIVGDAVDLSQAKSFAKRFVNSQGL